MALPDLQRGRHDRQASEGPRNFVLWAELRAPSRLVR